MNQFNLWNTLKQNLDSRNEKKFVNDRDVWMIYLGNNIGFEQNGCGKKFSRPVIVLKKFNNKMFWVIPLTTKQKDIDFYFNFTDVDNRPVAAIIAQLRIVSVKRFSRKLYTLDTNTFYLLNTKLMHILFPQGPKTNSPNYK